MKQDFPPKRLIEEYFPARELSHQARREKKGHPPTYQMHYWWSRKPLIVSRAAVLASVLSASTNIDNFDKLLGFDAVEPPYMRSYSSAEKEFITRMSITTTNQSIIVDPFAGGGSIPFEVLRAGLSCVSLDISPVAWMIQKVTLEFPRRFGKAFVTTIENYARSVIERVNHQLGHFFPTFDAKTVIAYLYAWEVKCPSCGGEIPLVNSWKLVAKPPKKSGEKGKYIFLKPRFNATKKSVEFEITTEGQVSKGNCVRARGWCLNPECRAKILNEWIRQQIRKQPSERLLAIVVAGSRGKEYHIPSKEQTAAITRAAGYWRDREETYLKADAVPRESIPSDPRAVTIHLYLDTWDQVANPRQRLVLVELVLAIRAVTEDAMRTLGPDQGKAVAMYLSCLLAKHLNRNCRITTWDVQGEKIVHACSNKLNAIQWNHAEINPFVAVSGSLEYSLRDILRGYSFAAAELAASQDFESPELVIANAPVSALGSFFTRPVDLIITDPPYYDDAPYGEISEFFFAWEARAIGKYISSENPLFSSPVTPKVEDISVSHARNGNHFGNAFVSACLELNKILTEKGRLVMFFAHSGWDAWNAVLEALMESHFRITATWPVHTESLGITNTGKTASLSSLILVACKNSPEEDDIHKIPAVNIKKLLLERWDEKMPRFWGMGFRGLDLLTGATGVALETLSSQKIAAPPTNNGQYSEVFSAIKEYVVDFTLRQMELNPEKLDPITKFYLFFHGNEMSGIPIAFAEMIAETLGIPFLSILQSGITSRNLPSGKKVSVLSLISKADFDKKSKEHKLQ
ncbi:MAG: DNA methylase containing a Zn-ribbon module [Promethearchaeota archaeon CR_4]|nr:MAG: DNA methylase containing a Zn-ribbon module [Candidatus Lokiarchaeota archaeon CR_4]